MADARSRSARARHGRAQILAPTVRRGDATGDHSLALAAALRTQFDPVKICAGQPAEESPPPDIAHQVNVCGDRGADPSAALTIVQYPLWYPLADQVRELAGAKIFWYHGVTPPALWGTEIDAPLLHESELKTTLTWHTHLAVTASPFTAHELERHAGYPAERIRVVPLGVDVERFSTPANEALLAELRTSRQLEERQVVLFVGRVAGNKRIDLLIDAAARLVDTHPRIKLLIVGDDSYNEAARLLAKQLRRQVSQNGLDKHVVLTGRVDSVEPYFHVADLLVLPSLHEGFGVPLVEAMAAGVPVVAGASGAMPWVLNGDGETTAEGSGLLFTPGDANDLARRIACVLDEPGLAATLRRRGAKRARAFSLANFTRNALAVCDEALLLAAEPTPFDAAIGQSLYPRADVALRDSRVRSNVPLVGRLIEWVRRNSTSHVKEGYLDPLIERQVRYNQLLAIEVEQLRVEVHALRTILDRLQAEDES